MKIKKLFLSIFLFSISFSIVDKTTYNDLNEVNHSNIRKKEATNLVNEDSDEETSECLEYVVENLDDIILENFEIFGYNGGYTFVEPFDEDDNLVTELKTGKYIDYQYALINYYSDLDSDVKDAFKEIYDDDADVNNMLKCINSNFNISVSNLSCVKDIAVSLEFKNQLIAIRNITGTSLRNPFLTFPSIGNINLNSVIGDSEVNTYSVGVLNAGTLDSMWTLSQVLAELGLTAKAIATIKASYYTIINTIKLVLPQAVKVSLIILACVAITAVCLSYWNQISAIFEAIIDTFVSAAEAFVDQIYSIFDSIMSQADESYATESVDIDGVTYQACKLTATFADSIANNYGDKKYYKVLVIGSTSIYSYIIPRRLDEEEALAILRLNNKSFNTYTFLQSDAYNLIQKAFPNDIIYGAERDNVCYSSLPFRVVIWHYHAKELVGTTYVKRSCHSFYGIPETIFPTC